MSYFGTQQHAARAAQVMLAQRESLSESKSSWRKLTPVTQLQQKNKPLSETDQNYLWSSLSGETKWADQAVNSET